MGFFLDDANGKLRSGWVVAIFAAIAAGASGILNLAVAILGLYPRAPISLDDGYLFFITTALLIAALVPTVICALAFKAEVGLPRARAPRDLLLGFALGAGLIGLAVLIPAALGKGALAPSGLGAGVVLLAGAQQLLTLGPTAVGEELMVRGVALRQLARGTRPWLAVALTGGAFGVLHLVNPNVTWYGALNVALVGCWFGVLALRTSLWTSVSAHLAWNWFEGFFFGQPVSGINPGRALFVGAIGPPGFFSGGEFGPEASGLTTVLLTTATLATAIWPKKS